MGLFAFIKHWFSTWILGSEIKPEEIDMYLSKWTTSAAEAAKETAYVMEHHSYLKSTFDVKKMKLEKENMQLAFKFLKLSPCQMLGDLAL